MKILTNYDFNQNQVLNIVIQKLAAAPANPVSGQMYYNTTSNRGFIYNGSEWIGMDSTGATMTAENIVNAINNSAYKIDDDNLSANVNNAISASHSSHAISDVTGLQDALDALPTAIEAQGYAATAESNANNYTDTAIAGLVDSAPEALDTLNELAAALGDDPNFATTITNTLAQKTDKFSGTVGDGTTTSYVLTHDLNSRDVVVMIRESASPYAQVITDVEMTTVNTITLKFAVAPTAGQYTVTVIG